MEDFASFKSDSLDIGAAGAVVKIPMGLPNPLFYPTLEQENLGVTRSSSSSVVDADGISSEIILLKNKLSAYYLFTSINSNK